MTGLSFENKVDHILHMKESDRGEALLALFYQVIHETVLEGGKEIGADFFLDKLVHTLWPRILLMKECLHGREDELRAPTRVGSKVESSIFEVEVGIVERGST